MTKQKLFLKHKDDIIIELTRRQDKRIADTAKNKIPRAVNHGWIQALKWVSGFDELYKMGDVPIITGDRDTDALLEDEWIAQESVQESLDRHRETQAEIAEYDKKISEEAAESEWRGTILHPMYESEYDEEE